MTLFFAGGGASETKTRRAFLVLVSERLRSCSSLSTCREPRYEAPVACFDHRSCPYHSAAPLIKLPEYVLKHHAPRTSHCGCTISILEDVENVRVGWSGGPGEPYPFVFWPVTEVWALGIGHYKCWSHNNTNTNTAFSNTSNISGSQYSYLKSLWHCILFVTWRNMQVPIPSNSRTT